MPTPIVHRRAAVLTILSLAGPIFAAPPSYTITLLATASTPDPYAFAYSINDQGTVALGRYNTQTSSTDAYLWHAGVATRILTPPGSAIVRDVGPTGVAVGQYLNPLDGTSRAFYYDPTTDTLTFPSVAGQPLYSLYAINARGQAAGTFIDIDPATGQWFAALWDPASGEAILPTLGNGVTAALDINNAGQAVGTSGDAPMDAFPLDFDSPLGQHHAVLWQNGTLVDLTPGHQWSTAYDINDRGQVVGEYMRVTPDVLMNAVPFLRDPDRGLITLPVPDQDSHTVANAINESGWVVGRTNPFYSNNSYYALLWSPDGALYDLTSLLPNDSGWVLEYANDINAAGQIVGTGTYLGQPAAFLLTPTPEPSATALLSCTTALVLRRRR